MYYEPFFALLTGSEVKNNRKHHTWIPTSFRANCALLFFYLSSVRVPACHMTAFVLHIHFSEEKKRKINSDLIRLCNTRERTKPGVTHVTSELRVTHKIKLIRKSRRNYCFNSTFYVWLHTAESWMGICSMTRLFTCMFLYLVFYLIAI